MAHPLVVGTGRRFFDGLGSLTFTLTGTQIYPTGVISLTYRKAS
jgi:hypothetical protein